MVAFLIPTMVVPRLHPLAGVLLRGSLVAVAFPAFLAVSGFFRPGELSRLRELATHLSLRPAPAPSSLLGLSSTPISVPVQEVAEEPTAIAEDGADV